jgi:CIC family chloride channel protein
MSDVSNGKEKTAATGPRPGDGEGADDRSGVLGLALLSLAAGAVTGLVGAVFRLSLDWADQVRVLLIAWAQQWGFAGLLLVTAACAIATAVSAWMVRRFSPHATGSGIPHVEAVMSGELPPATVSLVPVKFAGGVLAIGSGLALGREGPSVQMGASLAHLVGVVFRRNWRDCRALLAAGAGAGLAAAFNAPIAGAVFVLEELVRRFETRTAVAALGASAMAIAVSRFFLGDVPDFTVDPLAFAGPQKGALFVLLGVIAGFLAVLYNRTLLATLALANQLALCPVEVRAGLIGAAVGVLAWFLPQLVGGGQEVAQRALAGSATLAFLPLVFLLRFGLACVSYAARTPGGLFAPMLVLGAELGLLFGLLCHLTFPDLGVQPVAFAVVGMAAYFTGVVRAPVTGIVLVIEMTASFPMFLPMLVACFAAMLVPTLLGDQPIYDSLRENTLRNRDQVIP